MRRIAICSVALAAALVVPAQAKRPQPKPHPPKSQGTGKSCAKKPTVNKGFTVRGTLVSYTADDPTTLNGNETSVVITVTGANRHARVSGELTGGPYTVDSSGTPADADLFRVRLSGYETGESPAAGDKVRIVGKIAVTRKKCADADASLDDRYGEVDIRKVKIIDVD